jgi:hypothetical protein
MANRNICLFNPLVFMVLHLMALIASADHRYRSYRWSVGFTREGGVMISTLPPVEEVGGPPGRNGVEMEKGIVCLERISWPAPNRSHRIKRTKQDQL